MMQIDHPQADAAQIAVRLARPAAPRAVVLHQHLALRDGLTQIFRWIREIIVAVPARIGGRA